MTSQPVTPLEGTLSTELFSKEVELDLLPAGMFILFLSSLVYYGDRGLSFFGTPYIFDMKICSIIFSLCL